MPGDPSTEPQPGPNQEEGLASQASPAAEPRTGCTSRDRLWKIPLFSPEPLGLGPSTGAAPPSGRPGAHAATPHGGTLEGTKLSEQGAHKVSTQLQTGS